MNYLLIQVLRKDDNGSIAELQRIYRYETLLIDPRENMSIRFENNDIFYVEYIRQDLKNNRVILYDYRDICHRDFWDKKFWETYLMAKIALGWKKVPKNWKYNENNKG